MPFSANGILLGQGIQHHLAGWVPGVRSTASMRISCCRPEPSPSSISHSDAAHAAFDGSERLGLRNVTYFVAQSLTPSDHCTLRIRRCRRLRNTRFPAARYHLTGPGVSPAGTRQLRLTHRYYKFESTSLQQRVRRTSVSRGWRGGLFASSRYDAQHRGGPRTPTSTELVVRWNPRAF